MVPWQQRCHQLGVHAQPVSALWLFWQSGPIAGAFQSLGLVAPTALLVAPVTVTLVALFSHLNRLIRRLRTGQN